MSLTQKSGGYGGPPPPRYPYPADRDNHSRPPPPRLPSMSSLLNHEPPHHEPRPNPFLARQSQPPYVMQQQQQQQPPQHSLYMSQVDPNALPQHNHHLPQQAPMNSHQSQTPSQPMLMPLQSPQSLATGNSQGSALPSQPNGEQEYSQVESGYRLAEASISPTQTPFSQGGQYSRRESTFSNASSRQLSQAQGPQAMEISGLLSEEPSPRRERPQPKFALRMRQQPLAARACGFGERDRRVIDPPPILQMDVSGPNMTATEISTLIRSPYSVIHCTLWDPETDKDATAMPGTTEKRQQRRLMGTLVASPFVGKDEHGMEGCFFTFPDLSVRTPGKYSLRFALVNLDPTRMGPGNSVPVRSTIWSSEFQVFNAKDFSGMRASTALTKTLKSQGCLISVKKGNGKPGSSHESDGEDGDDDNNDDGPRSSRRAVGRRSRR
ncbi:uncharacterized protein L3040_000646 [Drepanopeziza brunnea f. sp. 'multigermtubi']|uniref:uncharacterized protein n=1 Tax=Drepanopeziza brunnea f. sp. 'multigermtubi' TaxID=698441 RepID=UPI00239A418F|nr:hypothetical protein L3040_000646 [Drepanopeziza brunnea f. sp. 'multigermtubi']